MRSPRYSTRRAAEPRATPGRHGVLLAVCLGLWLGASAVACVSSGRSGKGPAFDSKAMPLSDAPYALASDRDLDDVLDLYQSLNVGDDRRRALRRMLAKEFGRRMSAAMERPDTHEDAYDRLLDLMALYQPAERAALGADGVARELLPYAALVREMRAHFARAGLDIETTATLYFATMADPANRAGYLAEVDEIFAYADDLARAENGDGAETSRPITILESLVEHAPLDDAVDRLVALYITRQELIARLFQDPDRRLELIRAHGSGVLETAWHITRVLARADRLAEAPDALGRFQGMGHDLDLARALDQALASDATAASWTELVDRLGQGRSKESEASKNARRRAVLAVCRAGMARFPKSAALARCAGNAARELDLLHVAIRYLEAAVELDQNDQATASELANLYRVRVSTLAFYERPLEAEKRLRELEVFHDRMKAKWPKKPLETDLADAYASMGQGMTSLGELPRATHYLERSIALRPTAAALEQLGTIAFKRDQLDKAVRYFERALAVPDESGDEAFERARIQRLLGDALAAAGKDQRAADQWKASIMSWMAIDSQYNLPPAYKGQLLVEAGKAQWALGDEETAMTAFDAAVDLDPDGADTHSSVVSFLIVRGHYQRALDTYHRALGSHAITGYSKVYMSLWVLAEARRSGQKPDPLAREYLASRKGTLWHDRLARFATGLEELSTLSDHVSTRGQRAELLYYSAVLDDQRASDEIRAAMQRVVDTGMVQFYEYDMAKYWLSEGFAPSTRTAAEPVH